MIRRPALLLVMAACMVVVGFSLLRLGGEHISTGHDALFEFAEGLGLFLLFIALICALVVYGRWSFKLAPSKALVIGFATVVVAIGILHLLAGRVSVHSWTFSLLALPWIIFTAGALAVLVGLFRLFKKYMEAQYK